MDQFVVVAGAGSLRSQDAQAVHFPHKWTPGGVHCRGRLHRRAPAAPGRRRLRAQRPLPRGPGHGRRAGRRPGDRGRRLRPGLLVVDRHHLPRRAGLGRPRRRSPVSSATSRTAACAGVSPGSTLPPMNAQRGIPSTLLPINTPSGQATIAATTAEFRGSTSRRVVLLSQLGPEPDQRRVRRRTGPPAGLLSRRGCTARRRCTPVQPAHRAPERCATTWTS